MASKNADRIIAILPFLLVFLAAVIGMKSEINLFSLCDLKASIHQQSIFNSSSERENIVVR